MCWNPLKIRRIMITGPQGCGKTTQAHLIADKLGVPFVGAGDLLRELAEEDTEAGRSVKASMDKGELVDDSILAGLIKKEVSQPEYQKGFVADGYPRTHAQLDHFDPNYDKVFYLKISDSEAERRLLGRGREDDTPKLIRERLKWYHEETQPLLDYYRKVDKLVIVDGERSIEDVSREIEKVLEGGSH